MKKLFYLACLSGLLISCGGGKKAQVESSSQTFKVLQFNIWQEGTMVPGGYEGIVSQILQSKADLITLSEVRNYEGSRFCDRIVQSLKDSGQVFYSFYSYDSGILSRYPIIDSTTIYPCVDDHGSAYRALIDMDGQEVALYTTHLDYLSDTYYDVKGYNGSTFKKRSPMLDVDSILEDNISSKRDDGMLAILENAKEDRAANRLVFIGGDFNEPSYLDWTEETKDMFSHNGVVVPWTVSKMLTDGGYIDTYRSFYPDPVTHPGITFPSNNDSIAPSKLTWAPESDERERVDFIYYAPFKGLDLKNVEIWGPDNSISFCERVKDDTKDVFEIGTGVWPTDHKAVLATFTLSK